MTSVSGLTLRVHTSLGLMWGTSGGVEQTVVVMALGLLIPIEFWANTRNE